MATRRKNNTPEESETVEVAELVVVEKEVEVAVVEAPKPPAPPAKQKKKKKKGLSLTQYASRKNIKARHLGGLRAFIKNPSRLRSLEEWDAAFKNY